MFTGIVERVGRLTRLEPVEGRIDLAVEVGAEIASGVAIGGSVAINGCCMTVTETRPGELSFQAIPETLRLTSLGSRGSGDRVNVERAMRADSRLDGHIVQGHIDGTGTVREIRRAGEEVILRVDCDSSTARLLVPKGSITVDGVSLTVVEPDEGGFSVALIPHTLKETTLGDLAPGDLVNLEADVLGKYVFRYMERTRCQNE